MSVGPLPGASPVEVAVIGMACRFPGANDIRALWHMVRNGIEGISFFSAESLLAAGVSPTELRHPDYVMASGVVDGIDQFDAGLFGLTPRGAEIIDPQQRLFLECSWEALESAGYDPARYDGAIGVFGGQSRSTYLRNVESAHDIVRLLGERAISIGNDKDHLTTSVAYRLNLRGPAVTVGTACSTSLVAVHVACQSLLTGESDIAIAGGATVRVPQRVGYLVQSGVHSSDGHTRTFDARADGTVPSGGVGVVVLKLLAAALADDDCIHAVIRASAINNDGTDKVGYTAPSVTGQASVIAEALDVARVHPTTVGLVEAHGTATPLGDPIEVKALTEAYRRHSHDTEWCAIGSIKSNIGHADSAAGIAGLLKAVLALEHEQMPPTLNFDAPNPNIDFAHSPFFVNTSLRSWPRVTSPRRAAVSSFGIGGTNAHVILEEAPTRPATPTSPPVQVITLSAASSSALQAQVRNLSHFLATNTAVDLPDVAHTLRLGRRELDHRAVFVCRDAADAVTALNGVSRHQFHSGRKAGTGSVTFVFPGGSAQHVGMGRELYEWEPVFRGEVDRCAALLEPELGFDIRQALYPDAAAPRPGLASPMHALPALFVTEFALATLWMSWGIRPDAMVGHSLGEYVAACLAGVLEVGDALRLVAVRSRLLQRLAPGAMLSIPLPETEIATRLDGRLSVAAVNGPAATVVSGPTEAIDELEAALITEGTAVARLRIQAAGHSVVVEPIADEFQAFVATLPLAPPQIPYLSGLTGGWISAGEATDPAYWGAHLRRTVRFSDGVNLLLQKPDRVLLEVGPGRTLTSVVLQHPARGPGHIVLPTLPHPDENASDLATAYRTLGRLWADRVGVDWTRFRDHERRRRVDLPTYPFQRQRYWIDFQPATTVDGGGDAPAAIEAQLHLIRRQLELLDGALAPDEPSTGLEPTSSAGA